MLPNGLGNSLGSVPRAELLLGLLEVTAHRFFAEPERCADIGGHLSQRGESQHG